MVTKTHKERYNRGQHTAQEVEHDEKANIPALPGDLSTVSHSLHGTRGR